MNQLPTALSIEQLKQLTKKLRRRIIQMSHDSKAPHLASSLSCVDMMTVIYWNFLNLDPQNPKDENRDRFILSKGHAAPTLYAVLAFKGFFPEAELNNYLTDGSPLAEHPLANKVSGVEAATGSLGHGFGIGLGMALATKTQHKNHKIFIIIGDGECNEGTIWEGAMFAAANKLDNVIAFVDYNKWQGTGRSNEILQLQSLKDKWQAFGWETYEIDGNNVEEIITTIKNLQANNNKPKMIIANTIKGKGVSFMEDDNNWHYKSPNEEELQKSRMELSV
jgi:transketolase